MIAPELEEMLEPLERFESIRRRAVRLGDRLADLSYANPYEGVVEAARAALRETLDDERTLDLQYTPFGGQTLARRAAADALRRSHAKPFDFRDIVLTPGAMSALHVALRAAAQPGDEILIPVPCWLDHPLYARAQGLVPKLVPLASGSFDLDPAAIAAAIGPRTAAVVLSQPANPTGRLYGPDVLAELGAAMRQAEADHERPITLISDESHRDFVSPGSFHTPADHYERTAIAYSFGKYHFLQGQRLGYAATSPDHPQRREVAEEMVRWTRIDGFATPTALMQRALPRLLDLEHDHGWIAQWRGRVVDGLRGQGYEVIEPEATMFIYARTPPSEEDDFAFVERLASKGTLALPAPVFHHRGHFRLSLTGSEQMIERALEVFAEVRS